MKRNPYLKVKLKSLAAEAKIIRAEELKYKRAGDSFNPYREGLYLHRVGKVRYEARMSLLAYQYMRGVPYVACEKPRKENRITKTQCKYIAEMVKRFANPSFPNRDEELVEKWLEGAASPYAKADPQLPRVRSASGFG